MYLKTILFFLAASVTFVSCNDLIVGDTTNNTAKLLYHTVAQYQPISWSRRTKYIFFSSPDLSIIRGIKIHDNLNSNSTANILVGGIGFTYVNIKLKSEKGKPLDYDIEIYA